MVQQRKNPHLRWQGMYAETILACMLVGTLLLAGGMLSPASVAAAPTYSVINDSNGQKTITVTGSGSVVTLEDIRQGLKTANALLENKGDGVWQLNVNLLIERDVTLNLSSSTGVDELQLRSQKSATATSSYDYSSFVYLRTNNGTITINDVWIHSWDPTTSKFDTDITNGRSYILAKYDARLDIKDAELSYLGSGNGESYGVSWRDTNDSSDPDTLRTRVTGDVINSEFHHNYYGVYTFQASGMVFRGNRFHHNIHYGFDPHDFSHHILVEDNQAFENGNHGFIISRGCNNFVFRNNASYNNNNPDPTRLAHGFMLDAGSPTSSAPQAPSFDNLLEQNHAYGNEGYGVRVLGSTNNTIRDNLFENNAQGITVEQGSTNNSLSGNTITDHQSNGIFVRGGGNNTRITGNTVTNNGGHGIYVKSNNNTLEANTVRDNRNIGVELTPETTIAVAMSDLSLPNENGVPNLAAIDSELVGDVVPATAITGNRIKGNTISSNSSYGIDLRGANTTRMESNTIDRNGNHGVYLRQGASNNRLIQNTITSNKGYGIRAYGKDVRNNTWSKNAISGNTSGGILVNGGANSSMHSPVITHTGTKCVRNGYARSNHRTVHRNRSAGTELRRVYNDTGRREFQRCRLSGPVDDHSCGHRYRRQFIFVQQRRSQ